MRCFGRLMIRVVNHRHSRAPGKLCEEETPHMNDTVDVVLSHPSLCTPVSVLIKDAEKSPRLFESLTGHLMIVGHQFGVVGILREFAPCPS